MATILKGKEAEEIANKMGIFDFTMKSLLEEVKSRENTIISASKEMNKKGNLVYTFEFSGSEESTDDE